MSYPPPRYTGETGEVSAVYRPASAPPEVPTGPTTGFRYLATGTPTGRRSGAATNGEYGLYQVDLGPKLGATTHFHKTISEAFYILSGTLRVFDGARWIDTTTGDFLHVPAGGLHAFRNDTDEPMSMLMLFTPGAPREEYFEEVGKLAELSEEERTAFLVRHDSYFV